MVSVKPLVLTVKRFGCPFCHRTHSRPVRAREHMARCWYNPAAKGCKTCAHFEPAESRCCGGDAETGCLYGQCDARDACARDVDLSGVDTCAGCNGTGWREGGNCLTCHGRGSIKPGPIVHCFRWAPKTDEENGAT